MGMQDNNEVPEQKPEPGYDWPTHISFVSKKTLMTALKVAVVGALVLAALATPLAAVGGMGSWLLTLVGVNTTAGTAVLTAAAIKGLMLGGIAGAAIGFVNGITGAEEAVEDKAAMEISAANRARQLAANQKVMEMNMARLEASQQQMAMGTGFSQQNQMLPNIGQGQGLLQS